MVQRNTNVNFTNKQNITWNLENTLKLYNLRKENNKSFNEIAKVLNKSRSSCEKKFKRTNWSNLLNNPTPNDKEIDIEEYKDNLSNALIELCRHDHERLCTITQDEFLRKININEKDLLVSYDEIKNITLSKLRDIGLENSELINLNEGTYIIVGDSHGKHTKTKMFEMLENLNKHIKATKIIHIGHLLDDDNDISYNWGKFNNLIILSKIEELQEIQKQRNKFNFSYEIIRGGISIGNSLVVMNQDIISDYVTTPIRSLDSEIFDQQVIVNCHRQEIASKCHALNKPQYFASPGSICEKHIIKTIRQIDFSGSKSVKLAFYGGFSKYRKMQHMYGYWNQGLIVVNVDKDGNHTIIPCQINKVKDEYATSYFNKVITNSGVKNPDCKIFVHGDTHSPFHDSEILDIQEQICKDYKANHLVNLGDAHDFKSLNHHSMEKGKVIKSDFLYESAQTYHILKRMRTWADNCHIIIGNHERFGKDFVSKFPQLSSCINFEFMCDIYGLGYNVTKLKNVLNIGSAKFIHGDMEMFGQNGTLSEKVSRTIGHNTFIGHVHYPSIRFGSFTVGLAGKMDQGYNEPEASSWVHGFGLCNQYKGISFMTTIAIFNNKCFIGNKTYCPNNTKVWSIERYKAKITYETE